MKTEAEIEGVQPGAKEPQEPKRQEGPSRGHSPDVRLRPSTERAHVPVGLGPSQPQSSSPRKRPLLPLQGLTSERGSWDSQHLPARLPDGIGRQSHWLGA